MVSVINPDGVEVWISDAGTDPLDTLTTSRVEVLGVGDIEIKGASKDVDQKVTFASSVSDRFYLVEKPATIVEISMDSAVFNMDDFADYFTSATNMAERTTSNFALGIKLTRSDSSKETFTFDPAYLTSVDIKSTKDDTVTASITMKAAPSTSKYVKV